MFAKVHVVRSTPKTVDSIGVPVATRGVVPRSLGMNRAALAAAGFEGKAGQTLGTALRGRPDTIAVGIGDERLTAPRFATPRPRWCVLPASVPSIATSLADLEGVESATAAQAVVEGALLAAYRYHGLKTEPPTPGLHDLTLIVGEHRTAGATVGADRGAATAAAAALARDLANTPPAHMTARIIAEQAVELGAASGLRRGVQQGSAGRHGLWRHGRRQPRQRRAATHGPADLHARATLAVISCSSARA